MSPIEPIRSEPDKHDLGLFDTEAEAASAYDEAARESFGEFAALNFPLGEERLAL